MASWTLGWLDVVTLIHALRHGQMKGECKEAVSRGLLRRMGDHRGGTGFEVSRPGMTKQGDEDEVLLGTILYHYYCTYGDAFRRLLQYNLDMIYFKSVLLSICWSEG